MLRRQPYDVMLLDLTMPRVSVFDVIEALAGAPERPAIIITAAAARVSGSMVGREGVCAVLQKPFDLGQLARVLSEVVEGARGSGPLQRKRDIHMPQLSGFPTASTSP